MARPKKWRKSAAGKEAAARAALPPPIPGTPMHDMLLELNAIYPGIAVAVAADQQRPDDAQGDLAKALQSSINGMMRAGGRRLGGKGGEAARRFQAIVNALRDHHPEWLTDRSRVNMTDAVEWLTKRKLVTRGSLIPDTLARKLRRHLSK